MTARGPLPRRHYRHGLLSIAPRTPAPTTPFVAKTCASLGSSPICLPERRAGAFRPPVLSHQPPQRLPRLAESKVKEANRIASTAKSPITLCHLGAQQRRWCIPIARISAWTPAARNAASQCSRYQCCLGHYLAPGPMQRRAAQAYIAIAPPSTWISVERIKASPVPVGQI